MSIKVLSQDMASKIAAGEVVERPASVVKELVENSLDASASVITVEVKGGGLELIRVTDNGHGIESGEMELAFQRFATSKIESLNDLEAISTLGFRGEALPSIAAVAHVTLTSRTPGGETGILIEFKHGEVVKKTVQGCPTGTSVTVRGLFQNVPARLKFLKSTGSEMSKIQAVVTHYAMAYPQVRFALIIEGSQVLLTQGNGVLRDVMAAVYDAGTAEAMLDVGTGTEAGSGNVSVSGLISPPSVTKSNRSHVAFFVNHRWVQSRLLGYAIEQAYHGFLMEKRYPVAVINLSLPYEEVDVNVHPTKAEVRFQKENQVFAVVQRAVRQVLTNLSPVPTIRTVETDKPFAASGSASRHVGAFWPTSLGAAQHSRQEADNRLQPSKGVQRETLKKTLPILRAIGQVQNTYIVAEGPDGLFLIDQHAAHERVLFEKIKADIGGKLLATQNLLEPVAVKLSPEQMETVKSLSTLLTQAGFDVEPFGADTYLIRGVPGLVRDESPADALLEILDFLNEGGGFQDWSERLAYSVACHSAIRAGKSLTQEEMNEMVRLLEECKHPQTCPHGRPTMIHLSSGQLEREFGRK